MTTRTTTLQPATKTVRILIGVAAASLAVLIGALLWQVRSGREPQTPRAPITTSMTSDDVAPRGGLAEQYQEQHMMGTAATARVSTNGMDEPDGGQRALPATTAPVTTRSGMDELYAEQQAGAGAAIERESRMGGMAELYRDQTTARGQ